MGDKSIIAFLCGVVSCYILTNSNKLNKLEDEIYKMKVTLDRIAKHNGIGDVEDKDIDDEICELLSSGKKIKAVKRYREITGLGLKESKDYVDLLNEKIRSK